MRWTKYCMLFLMAGILFDSLPTKAQSSYKKSTIARVVADKSGKITGVLDAKGKSITPTKISPTKAKDLLNQKKINFLVAKFKFPQPDSRNKRVCCFFGICFPCDEVASEIRLSKSGRLMGFFQGGKKISGFKRPSAGVSTFTPLHSTEITLADIKGPNGSPRQAILEGNRAWLIP